MPTRHLRSAIGLAVCAALLAACASITGPAPAPQVQPMTGLGSTTFVVTARDEQARAWFAHGLLLAYAFEHAEAARVFKAAAARDPSCAMCAWGVAYALGPNINNPNRGPVREIRRYIAQAQAAAAGATAVERALIDAMAVRYGRGEDKVQAAYEAQGAALCTGRPSERPVDPQDLAYAAAMRDVVARFPQDPDVVTLYADAAMNASPWDWWDKTTGAPRGAVADVVQRLQATTQAHPQHTGALHFYIHIAELSPDPRQAEAAADQIARIAPEAPHLVHMPSHIYRMVDRFADAVRVNQQALEVRSDGREYVQILPLVTLVRGERWDEILAEPAPPQGLGLTEGYWHYARGMAYARSGALAQARSELARFEAIGALTTVQRARVFGESAAQFMTVARGTLEATIARADRRPQDAIAPLRKAAAAEDEIGGEPPLLGAAARIALAGTLIDARQFDEARKALDEAVRLNGPSAWTHHGNAQLAQLAGRSTEAARSTEQARQAWSNAERRELPAL